MKQLETKTVYVGDNTFYIKPFPAFKAANISGQLATLVTPILGGLLPLVGKISGDESGESSIMDIDMEAAAPALSGALSSLSGDRVEALLNELLTKNKTIHYENFDNGKTELLTMDTANEVFCADVQDMYMLAWEVIKLNFSGFFKKLGAQFGSAFESLIKKVPSTENTES